MNKLLLESIMKLNGDTGTSLAYFLGISRSTFSAKKNETNGAEFTQSEIAAMKSKYLLEPEQIDSIFFNRIVSELDTKKEREVESGIGKEELY